MVSGKSSQEIPSITIKCSVFKERSSTFILHGLANFEECVLYRMTFFIHRSREESLASEETVKSFLINSTGHEIQFRRSQLLSDFKVQVVGAARDLHFIQCTSSITGSTNTKVHIGHDLVTRDVFSLGILTI